MAGLQIQRAQKTRAFLRMNIEGQPGGGKTYTSLLLAKLLIGEPFKLTGDQRSKIVLIDSERSSASLYADEFTFETIDLAPTHHGSKGYIEAIRLAEQSGAAVIVCDSITHEWKWCLAEVDRIKPRFGGNKWSAWSEVRPPHDDFLDAMMGCGAHLIATTRAKPATSSEKDDNGKTVIKKLGLEGIQDDMIEFAFGVVLRMDSDHNGIITKTRCRALDGGIFPLPGEGLATILRTWLDSGDPMVNVAHTLDAAILQGIELAKSATTPEQKRAAWDKAKGHVLAWCKGHGRTGEEATEAIRVLTEKVKAAVVAAPKTATAPADPPLTDAEHARRIDEGKA